MAATVHDIVNANLVLVGVGLLNTPEETERFGNDLDADVQVELGIIGMGGGMPEPSRKIILNRERIILNVSLSRTSIDKEYPSRESPLDDFAKLAEVAQCAISNTASDGRNGLAAFGYNVEMVFDQDSGLPAIQYLGNRLFGNRSFGKEGQELVGGTGQIILNDERGHHWTITVRPRSDDEKEQRIALRLNLHLNKQHPPDAEEIKTSLEEVWLGAKNFMVSLDRQG